MLIRYHLFIATNIKNELGIIMGWKADGFARMGCILGGRDALSVYGYCSSDNYMTFLEFEDVKEELLRGFCLVKGLAPSSVRYYIDSYKKKKKWNGIYICLRS